MPYNKNFHYLCKKIENSSIYNNIESKIEVIIINSRLIILIDL